MISLRKPGHHCAGPAERSCSGLPLVGTMGIVARSCESKGRNPGKTVERLDWSRHPGSRRMKAKIRWKNVTQQIYCMRTGGEPTDHEPGKTPEE